MIPRQEAEKKLEALLDEIYSDDMKTLELAVERRYFAEDYTIGDFLVEGKKLCDTLENKDRGLDSSMSKEEIAKIKVYGQTAIPYGRYRVIVNDSPSLTPKYKCQFCRLEDVPGFEGTLIHRGNHPKDTNGCVLPGSNTVKGAVMSSTVQETAIRELVEKAIAEGKEVYLTVRKK